MQVTMQQRIFIATKSYNQVQTNSEFCFHSVYLQIKPQLEKKLENMTGMANF